MHPGLAHSPDDLNQQAIREALETMLQADGTFVLCEVPGTDSFVQFANVDGGILLDLPIVALSGDQLDRADAFFWRLGGVLKPWRDEIEGGSRSYQVDLGRDTTRAAQLALEILREVHGEPDLTKIVLRTE